jgi:heme/copper-type cytochrome/quinol oxidase subunit 3
MSTAGHRERTALMGMAIFVASWAMLFAALFFAYGLARLRAVIWPPADLPPLPVALPALATAVLGASSLTLQRWRGDQRRGLLVTAALGALFLLCQAIVWRRLFGAGLFPSAGAYASYFWALTVFHALHVVVGLGALGWLAARPRPLARRLWTIYWHMVGIIWGVMFALVYVIR